MAIVTINDEHLTNIAGAIREKNGTTDTYKPADMAAAISAIAAGGGEVNMVEASFTSSSSSTGLTPFNVYDYVDSTEDILFLMVRLGYDRTDYSNHMTYIKDYCFYIPNDTHADQFSSSEPGSVLGALTNPSNYGYAKSTTFDGYQKSGNPAIGITSAGTIFPLVSNYTSNTYTFRWTYFNKFYGTSTSLFHVWMIYK